MNVKCKSIITVFRWKINTTVSNELFLHSLRGYKSKSTPRKRLYLYVLLPTKVLHFHVLVVVNGLTTRLLSRWPLRVPKLRLELPSVHGIVYTTKSGPFLILITVLCIITPRAYCVCLHIMCMCLGNFSQRYNTKEVLNPSATMASSVIRNIMI